MEPSARKNEHKRKKKQRQKMYISRTTIFISIMFIVITLGISTSIIIKYRETERWETSAIQNKQANIPPEFAKNTYSLGMANDIDKLTSITDMLNVISTDNGITSKTIDEATRLLSESKSILEKYQITGGDSYTNQESLDLYIKVYTMEQTAYTQPNAEQLSFLMDNIYKHQLTTNSKLDKILLDRLNIIATNYQTLNEFLDTELPKLGTIENNIITVSDILTKEQSNSILNTITEKDLDIFPHIKELTTIMTSKEWETTITNNQSLTNEQNWEQTLMIFKTLSKSQYYNITDITTLTDAQQIGAQIQGLTHKTNYEILGASPVTSISIDGQIITKNQFIKYGTPIIVTIQPTYKQVKSESTQSSATVSSSTHITQSSSTSSSSSEDTTNTTDTTTTSTSEELQTSSH